MSGRLMLEHGGCEFTKAGIGIDLRYLYANLRPNIRTSPGEYPKFCLDAPEDVASLLSFRDAILWLVADNIDHLRVEMVPVAPLAQPDPGHCDSDTGPSCPSAHLHPDCCDLGVLSAHEQEAVLA